MRFDVEFATVKVRRWAKDARWHSPEAERAEQVELFKRDEGKEDIEELLYDSKPESQLLLWLCFYWLSSQP